MGVMAFFASCATIAIQSPVGSKQLWKDTHTPVGKLVTAKFSYCEGLNNQTSDVIIVTTTGKNTFIITCTILQANLELGFWLALANVHY